jgi:hypothetical protein
MNSASYTWHDSTWGENFWVLIRKQQELAGVAHGDEVYFVLWSLVQSGEKLKYVSIFRILQSCRSSNGLMEALLPIQDDDLILLRLVSG